MAKTAAAPAAAEAGGEAAPAKKGKKKLIIIIAAVVVLLGVAGGGAAVFMAKKKAAEAAAMEDEEDEGAAKHADAHAKVDINHPPVFVPLEPFVINLADKDSDRYAQIAVTLQVVDAKFAEQLKAFMPAIRNSILMVLAHKTSQELLERTGKEQLAQEIMREAVRPMGINIEAPHAADKGDHGEKAAVEEEDESPKKKKKKKAAPKEPETPNPIQQVHFANFIIQ